MTRASAFLIATTALLVPLMASNAHAWGCLAAGKDGSSGYSFGYPLKSMAEKRALRECENAAKPGIKCRISECSPKSTEKMQGK